MPPEARSSADPNSPALLDSVAPGWNCRGYLNFDPRYQPFCFNPSEARKKGVEGETRETLPYQFAMHWDSRNFPEWWTNGQAVHLTITSTLPFRAFCGQFPIHFQPSFTHTHTQTSELCTKGLVLLKALRECLFCSLRANYTPAVLAYAYTLSRVVLTRGPQCHLLTQNFPRRFWTWLNWITIKIVVEMYLYIPI